MRGAHRGFPHFTFLQLAVAQQRVNARLRLLDLQAHRHAERDGETLPQRAGRSFHPRHVEHVRMALEFAVQLAQRKRLALVAEAVLRTDRVKRGGGMALGQHEAVAVRIVHRVGPEIQFRAEEACQNVRAGHRAPRMAGTGMIDRRDRMLAHEGRRCGDVVHQIRRQRLERLLALYRRAPVERYCLCHVPPQAARRARAIRSL